MLWVGAVFLWSFIAVFPLPTKGSVGVVAGAVVTVVGLSALTVLIIRHLPGTTSWADVFAVRRAPARWPSGLILVTLGSLAYVAVQRISTIATQILIAHYPTTIAAPSPFLPDFQLTDPSEIPADALRAIGSGVNEEIFAVMGVALSAAVWRRLRCRPGRLARAQAVVLAALPLVVLCAFRFLAHTYQGGVVIRVLPWLVGSWLILSLCGTLWPLLIGHVMHNTFALIGPRIPDSAWWTTTQDAVLFAGVIALFLLPLMAERPRAILQAWDLGAVTDRIRPPSPSLHPPVDQN